jgi:UDP-N-acetylmuramate--alanine ligase
LPSSTVARPNGFAPLKIHKIPRAHLVGIAGCGMRALAEVLDAAGWQVSGSDLQPGREIDPRFEVYQGHQADAIDRELDLVVYSDAVPGDNVELSRARQCGLPTLSYPQMLARLMESRRGVAIAGTHGKSTTTAMMGEILLAAGVDPTVVFGATPFGHASGGRLGRGRWMLVEACEYRANFRHLKPELAAILNVEPDHFDCFNSPAELETAFARFVGQVPEEGLVLVGAECAAAQRAIAGLACASESFGFTAAATWRATELRERRGFYSFRVRCRERFVCDVKLHVPGRHNVLDALAATALASHCGATGTDIRVGLERFSGLRRRLELLGETRGIAVVDDYAHHPTAVTAALATVRQIYPDRRVWCVFQPHQASRTAALLDDFAHSLQNAARIIVAPIFRAREAVQRPGEVTAADLAARIVQRGHFAIQLASAAEIQHHLQQSLRSGDVLVTLGAGDIGTVAHEFSQGLGTFRQAS